MGALSCFICGGFLGLVLGMFAMRRTAEEVEILLLFEEGKLVRVDDPPTGEQFNAVR